MVKVNIRGKEFPLCLTVAALDKVTAKCGPLSKITDFLDGSKNLAQASINQAWLLGLLIQEGEANRRMEARFTGEKSEPIAVPSSEDIAHLMTYAEMCTYSGAVYAAVEESLVQTIEAVPEKNGEAAGGV